MLEQVKKYLRITATTFDDEIADLIEACKSDMELVGISPTTIQTQDVLIKRAIVTYCKAYFGIDNPDREKFIESYESLRNHLSIANEYSNYFVIEEDEE